MVLSMLLPVMMVDLLIGLRAMPALPARFWRESRHGSSLTFPSSPASPVGFFDTLVHYPSSQPLYLLLEIAELHFILKISIFFFILLKVKVEVLISCCKLALFSLILLRASQLLSFITGDIIFVFKSSMAYF